MHDRFLLLKIIKKYTLREKTGSWVHRVISGEHQSGRRERKGFLTFSVGKWKVGRWTDAHPSSLLCGKLRVGGVVWTGGNGLVR